MSGFGDRALIGRSGAAGAGSGYTQDAAIVAPTRSAGCPARATARSDCRTGRFGRTRSRAKPGRRVDRRVRDRTGRDDDRRRHEADHQSRSASGERVLMIPRIVNIRIAVPRASTNIAEPQVDTSRLKSTTPKPAPRIGRPVSERGPDREYAGDRPSNLSPPVLRQLTPRKPLGRPQCQGDRRVDMAA